MKYRAVLFDFDYTLGDTTEGIVLSANAALKRMGLQEQPEEAIRRTIGLSLRDTYRALTGDGNPEAAESFAAFFREKADQVMAESAVLYPCVPTLLKALRAQEIRTGIVTTKFRYRILQILGKYGLTDSVDCIVGAEDVKKEKPSPEGILLAMERLGAQKEETLYVGDSAVDAAAAERACVDFAGVLTGTTPEEALRGRTCVWIGKEVGEIKKGLTSPPAGVIL